MKHVKKCVSLPDDLYRYANLRARQLRKERGSKASVSSVIAELIAADKQRAEAPLPKAA